MDKYKTVKGNLEQIGYTADYYDGKIIAIHNIKKDIYEALIEKHYWEKRHNIDISLGPPMKENGFGFK